jgi:excisionase family DNA binding protein
MNLLTTKEVAEHLGVSVRRVHQFIEDGRLPAEKRGRDYFIDKSNLKFIGDRKIGRPPKVRAKSSKASKTSGNK